jgi:small subunit ribosomal protein S4
MAENSCRDCRKFGDKLFLKGERCLGPKCAVLKRSNTPGTSGNAKAGQTRKRKKSEYGIQLQEKQKAKREYGMREKQFHLVYQKAVRLEGATGELMLQILERRLDNVIYRLGWAVSRRQARQIVGHGHIKVNGEMLNIPSAIVKVKDTIGVIKTDLIDKENKQVPPSWLKVDHKKIVAEVKDLPKREEIETPVDEQLIVEYYSR